MRESFIVSPDKNNGYPSFSDSVDIHSDFYQNQNIFIANGINYPVFKNKSYPEPTPIINTAFCSDDINYPQMKNVKFSLISGAFANCTNMTKVSISESVKFIGKNSFRNTKLTSVKIVSDCIYSPESFPDNCQIVNFL